MALKLGIAGPPNSGKSFSRKTIKDGESVFIIAPSAKATHMTTSDGLPLKRLNPAAKTFEEAYPGYTVSKIVRSLVGKDLKSSKFIGNYVNSPLEDVIYILKFINSNMPQIKTVILPDFTHFISKVLANKDFIKRKSGGEAFQRFWELAGEVMDNLLLSIDDLREDLIVITEYHTEFDENLGEWVVFTPGGKMITEKFKLESYYDYMLFTHIDKGDDGVVDSDSYKFVTRRWEKYPARMSELFKETLIPNDLSLVLSEMRKINGI